MHHFGAPGAFGMLSKDCWSMVGRKCTVTSRFKIAATCSKLRTLFYSQFDLNKWADFITTNNLNNGLRAAAQDGNRDFIDFFILRGAFNWDMGLMGAVSCNVNATVRRDLVDLFIEKGAADWNVALASSARGGHRNLVDFFIEKGASNWNWALHSATWGGHRDLIDFFISKCIYDNITIEWNLAHYHAVKSGHHDLAEFFNAEIAKLTT